MVNVYLRLRPLNKYEIHRRSRNVIEIVGENNDRVLVDGEAPFDLDGIQDDSNHNQHALPGNDLYRTCSLDKIPQQLLQGQDCSIVVYGSSGTGRSTTVQDVVSRLIPDLFAQLPGSREITLRLSCCELYLERIRDLLSESNTVHVRERKLSGLAAVSCVNANDVMEIIQFATAKRTHSATLPHKESNRSTMIIQLSIFQTDLETGVQYQSTVKLYDCLASELRHTPTSNEQLEPRLVSFSLQALHKSVQEMIKGKTAAITSKRLPVLAKLLLHDLQKTRCTVIVTASPSHLGVDETLHSLQFGMDCRHVESRVSFHCHPPTGDAFAKQEQLERLVQILAHECKRMGEESLSNHPCHEQLWAAVEQWTSKAIENIQQWQIKIIAPGEMDTVPSSEMLDRLQSERDQALADRSQLSSDLAILQAQALALTEQNKLQQQELEKLRRENKTLRINRQKLEDHLRTSQFRESEAVVFLRQLRRFYFRLLKKTANEGSGDVFEIAKRVPGAPDLAQLVDIDHFMMKSGLLEESEIGGDVSLNCRPSQEALERSTNEAQKVAHQESEEEMASTSSSNVADEAEPLDTKPPPSPAIGRNEAADKVEARQKLYQTPAGKFITMREKMLEEELLQLSEMNMKLKAQLVEEKTNVDALTEKMGVAAAFDKMRVAQDMRSLKEQLERKNSDLKAVIWKMNELHMVGKSLQSQAANRDHHVSYLEESYRAAQSKCAKAVTESVALEKKLQQEIQLLQERAEKLAGPVWRHLEVEKSRPSLSGRLLIPFVADGARLDDGATDNVSTGEPGEWIDEAIISCAKSLVDATTQTSTANQVEASVQTDDVNMHPSDTGITTDNVDSFMFMDSPETKPRRNVADILPALQAPTGRSFDSLKFMNSPETKRPSVSDLASPAVSTAKSFMFIDNPQSKSNLDTATTQKIESVVFLESPETTPKVRPEEDVNLSNVEVSSKWQPSDVEEFLFIDSPEAKPRSKVALPSPQDLIKEPAIGQETVEELPVPLAVPVDDYVKFKENADGTNHVSNVAGGLNAVDLEAFDRKGTAQNVNNNDFSGPISEDLAQSPRIFGMKDRERPSPRKSPVKYRSHTSDVELPEPAVDFFGFDVEAVESKTKEEPESDLLDFIVNETSVTMETETLCVSTGREFVPDFLDNSLPDPTAVDQILRETNSRDENGVRDSLKDTDDGQQVSKQTSDLIRDVAQLLSSDESNSHVMEEQDDSSSQRSPRRSQSEFVARPKKKPAKNLSSLLGRLQTQHAQKKLEDDEKTETPEFMRLFRKIAHNNKGETVLETSGAVAPRDASELRAGSLLPSKVRTSTPFSESPAKSWQPKRKSKPDDDSSGSSDDSFARQFIQGARMGGTQKPRDESSRSDEASDNDSECSRDASQNGYRLSSSEQRSGPRSERDSVSEESFQQEKEDKSNCGSSSHDIYEPRAEPSLSDALRDNSDSSSSTEGNENEFQSQISPPLAPTTQEPSQTRSYFSDSDSSSASDSSTEAKLTRTAAPLSTTQAKAPSNAASFGSESSSNSKESVKAKSPSASPPTRKKSIYSDSSDSDSSDSDSSSNDDDDSVIARKAVTSANTALKRASVSSSSSDGDSNADDGKEQAFKTSPVAPATRERTMKIFDQLDSSTDGSSSGEETALNLSKTAPDPNKRHSGSVSQSFDCSDSNFVPEEKNTPGIKTSSRDSSHDETSDKESISPVQAVNGSNQTNPKLDESSDSSIDSDSSAGESRAAKSTNKVPVLPTNNLSRSESESSLGCFDSDSDQSDLKLKQQVPSKDSNLDSDCSDHSSDSSDESCSTDEDVKVSSKNLNENSECPGDPEVIDLTDHPEPGPKTRVPDYSAQIQSGTSTAKTKKKIVVKKLKQGSSVNASTSKSPAQKPKFVVKNGKLLKNKTPVTPCKSPGKGKKAVTHKVAKKVSSKRSFDDTSHTNLSALDRLNESNKKDRRLSLDSQVPNESPEAAPKAKVSTKKKKTKKAVFSIVGGKLVKQEKTKKSEDGTDEKPKLKKKVVKKKKVKAKAV